MFGWLRRKSTGPKNLDQIIRELDDTSGGGIGVSDKRALEVGVVLACVQIIADGIAVPELYVMRDLGEGQKEKASDDGRYRLLHRRPNDFQTSFEFRQMMTAHAALTGAAYFLPVPDARGTGISELLPLMPNWVTLDDSTRFEPIWRVRDDYGSLGDFRYDQIVVLRNMSWEMLRSLNPVRQARAAIGLSMANEQNLTALARNGGRPSGLITTENQLSPEAIGRIKAAWGRITSGAGRSGVGVLDNGVKFQPISMTSIDAQTLETRRFQVEEICRAFGVFPIMVGHADKTATYASAEAFFKAHERKTVLRWQRLWAEKLDEWVLDGDGPLFVEFDNQEERLAALKDQAAFFGRALGSGGGVPFMTVNEVRASRGLPPVEDGDVMRWPAASTIEPPEGEDDDQTLT